MELAIVSSERDWSQHFRRIVVTNCHYWLNRVRADAKSVLRELPQVLQGLAYALAVTEAWRPARDLLVQLSPWLLRQGPATTWERYLSQGIDRAAAEGDPVEIELRLQLGHLYQLQGRLAEARVCCRQALALGEQYQSHPHHLTLLNQLGLIARLAAQHDEALAYCRQVLAAPELPLAEQAEAHNVLGLVAHDRREWVEALAHFDQALSAYRALGDPYQTARMLNNRGLVLLRSDRLAEAAESYQAAITHFAASEDRIEQFKAVMNLGNVYLMQQAYAQAIAQYQTALPHFQQYHYLVDQAHTYNNLGMAHTGLKEWAVAEASYQRSIDLWQTLGDAYNLANALDNLGELFSESGQPARAAEILRQALAVLAPVLDNPANQPLHQAIERRLAGLDLER